MKLRLQLLPWGTIQHHLQRIGSIKHTALINQIKWLGKTNAVVARERRLSSDAGWKSLWKSADLNLGVHAEQSEECVHVDERLSGLSVHCAQEVEGQRELKEKSVDHHQISHSHGPLRYQQQWKKLETSTVDFRRIKVTWSLPYKHYAMSIGFLCSHDIGMGAWSCSVG